MQENIVVSDKGHAKIVDFGVSLITELQGFTTSTQNVNVRHSAPELMPLVASSPLKPTRESDIFSLGILFMQVRIPH